MSTNYGYAFCPIVIITKTGDLRHGGQILFRVQHNFFLITTLLLTKLVCIKLKQRSLVT